MDFPHLTDNAFPHISNVNPYSTNPTFDYTRYDGMTAQAMLCNVTWDEQYIHAVNWTVSKRDSWFAALNDKVVCDLGFTRLEMERVSVDVPLDTARLYNYVVLRFPALTIDAPIRHEGADGVRVLFAFIDDYIYKAPSTTELVLSLDVWTTYLPHTYITGCMLDRGHAPMWALSADTYLNDPITHTEYLSTPDDSFAGDPEIVRDSDFTPVFTSDPMLIIASTIPHDELNSLVATSANAGSAATYSDTGARNGAQVGVNGYVWSANGSTYSGMVNPSDTAHATGNVITPWLYAIESVADLETIAQALPQLITSAKACVVVPSAYVTLSQTKRTIGTATVWACSVSSAMHALETFTITKTKFHYPTRYADIAKLYTFPYARLTVSDDMGNSITIRVEDTHGTLDIKDQLSMTLGALSWDALVTNVSDTSTAVQYTIKTLTGQESKSIVGSDFAARTIDLGIPTYALYLMASTVAGLETYANAQAQRRSAITNYQNSMRSANNTYENTDDAATTSLANATASANTAYSNAVASADTALANATAAANTAYSNATASADTALANATAAANTAYSNAAASADTALANATAAANTAYGNAVRSANTALTNATAAANTAYSNAEDSADATLLNTKNTNATLLANATLDNALRTAIAGYQNTATADLTSNANQNAYDTGNADGEYTMYATDAALKSESVSGVANMMAHAAAGDAMGVVSAGVASIVNITTKQALADLSELNTYTKIAIAQDHNSNASATRQALNTNVATATNTNNTSTTTNSTTTSNTNAQNTRDVAVYNASATQTTEITMAGNTNTTALANALDTKNTSISTATATNTTTKANALATKNTSISTATATNTTDKANALTSKNTSISTATATNTTTKANALATKNTSISTATATKTVTIANADETRDTTEENLKQTLETTRLNWQDSITAQAAHAPSSFGTQSGNALADTYGRKGVHVRVITQSAGAIARAGDMFIRYGYRYDGLWNISDLVPSNKAYSYWQTSDLFLRSATIPNDVEHRLRAIFTNGVTIWNDPAKIGDFS